MLEHQSQHEPVCHPSCPVCTHGHGHATSISLGHGQRTLHYRCDNCAHVWHETTSDDDALFSGIASANEMAGGPGPKH